MKPKYTQQIKMKRQHITLIHKKNSKTDQHRPNKPKQKSSIHKKLSTKTPSHKMRTGISCETKNANTVYRFPNPQQDKCIQSVLMLRIHISLQDTANTAKVKTKIIIKINQSINKTTNKQKICQKSSCKIRHL